MLAAEPETGPTLMKAVETLRKLLPEGAVPKGIADAKQQQFMQQERQSAPILAALQALKGAGVGAGGPPGAGAPGGAPPGLPGMGGGMPMPPGGPPQIG